MNINYMSLGYDCSPAATLRNLDFRTEALPFDWVVSDLQILINCIDDNFDNYHKNLYFNNRRSRLIDSYGSYLANKFKKNNIYFVISSKEIFKGNHIITCDTEKNGSWNDASLWSEAINSIKLMNNL